MVSSIGKKYNNIVQDVEDGNNLRKHYIEIHAKNNQIDIIIEKYMLVILSILIVGSFFNLWFLIGLFIIGFKSVQIVTERKYLSLGFTLGYNAFICKKYNLTESELNEIKELIYLLGNNYYEIEKLAPTTSIERIKELLSL